MGYWILTPAYGRDYKSRKEVVAALNQGKDFEIAAPMEHGGRYCGLQDIPEGSHNVRYKRLANVAVVKVVAPEGGKKVAR